MCCDVSKQVKNVIKSPEKHKNCTKMDITAFSDENFDTKTWINEILKNNADMDKKENYTMSLVMKLQLYVQQVNNSLEETSHNILASMPKIIRDSKSLQQEALALKEKMEQVREEITKIEEDTGKSINSIEQLDKMKAKLMDAKQGLHESDNWTVLGKYFIILLPKLCYYEDFYLKYSIFVNLTSLVHLVYVGLPIFKG
ncbi:conserved oligomeric Golgi complex subunit 7-like [Atheta coriaria]|uniref:conserved oligomeric Golgi complex subunit 7-like n=1 Tax=Dalotia coriaria TaxID=877792 RepID=UPI0031F37325